MRKPIKILQMSLLSAALLCLTACLTTSGFTVMTKAERAEFERVCGKELERCPEIERYLGRLEKLKRQSQN